MPVTPSVRVIALTAARQLVSRRRASPTAQRHTAVAHIALSHLHFRQNKTRRSGLKRNSGAADLAWQPAYNIAMAAVAMTRIVACKAMAAPIACTAKFSMFMPMWFIKFTQSVFDTSILSYKNWLWHEKEQRL